MEICEITSTSATGCLYLAPSTHGTDSSIRAYIPPMQQCWRCEYVSSGDQDLDSHMKDVHGHIRMTPVEEHQGGEEGKSDSSRGPITSLSLRNNLNSQGMKADDSEITSASAPECLILVPSTNATDQLIMYIPPLHQCVSCEYVASDDRDLDRHINYIHGKISTSPQPGVQYYEKVSPMGPITITPEFLCEKDTKVENCKVTTTSALCSAPSAKATRGGTVSKKVSPKSSTKRAQFLCEKCDFRTNRKQHLIIHAKRHTGMRDQGGISIDKNRTQNPTKYLFPNISGQILNIWRDALVVPLRKSSS